MPGFHITVLKSYRLVLVFRVCSFNKEKASDFLIQSFQTDDFEMGVEAATAIKLLCANYKGTLYRIITIKTLAIIHRAPKPGHIYGVGFNSCTKYLLCVLYH